MKKILSLALAAMMLLSMSAVAFAADDAKVAGFADEWMENNQDATTLVDDELIFEYDYDANEVDTTSGNNAVGTDIKLAPGQAVYLPFVFENAKQDDTDDTKITHEVTTKSITGLNIRTEWYANGSKVESVQVVKVKYDNDEYAYALEIKTVDDPTYSGSVTIDGAISLFQNGWEEHDKSSNAYVLDITGLGYGFEAGTIGTLTNETQRFTWGLSTKLPDTMFYFDSYEVGFDGYLEFDATTAPSTTLGYANSAWNQDIAMEYAMYNLDFLNIFFNATKDIEAGLAMDEDAVLYMVNADGMLEMVKGEWDYDYYVFDAPRAMEGVTYVISYDGELPIAEVTPEPTPEVEDEKDNVATGASL